MKSKELIIQEKRKIIADVIKQKRKEKKMTQSNLGKSVGLTKSSIYRIEKAVFSPNSDLLFLILEELDITFYIEGYNLNKM